MAKFSRHIPNLLTCVRLALIPVLVVLMINPSRAMLNAAIIVFMVAAFTDYIDGLIARKWELVSNFGKLLDPLADKILVMTVLVMLVSQRSDLSGEPWVPGWMVVAVLAREIWVTGVRGLAAERGVIVAASGSGKVKSVVQIGAIWFLLLHDLSFTVLGVNITCQLIGINLLLISIVISYFGAAEYTAQVLKGKQA